MTSLPATRRPRRDTPVTFRVRAELYGPDPSIWRRLDLRSDVYLDELRHVLQAAFDWTDSHLHRFALGGEVFDTDADWFLCSFDLDEEGGSVAAHDVRLDETLAAPDDLLSAATTTATTGTSPSGSRRSSRSKPPRSPPSAPPARGPLRRRTAGAAEPRPIWRRSWRIRHASIPTRSTRRCASLTTGCSADASAPG
jgi:hypothetical protein